jgi:hypothetical protein
LIKPRDTPIEMEGQLDAAAFGEISTLPQLLHRRRVVVGDD